MFRVEFRSELPLLGSVSNGAESSNFVLRRIPTRSEVAHGKVYSTRKWVQISEAPCKYCVPLLQGVYRREGAG